MAVTTVTPFEVGRGYWYVVLCVEICTLGIGPIRALALVRKYGDIETILQHLDRSKYTVPEDWQFAEARCVKIALQSRLLSDVCVRASRRLFTEPEVVNAAEADFKWGTYDADGLMNFLVQEKVGAALLCAFVGA